MLEMLHQFDITEWVATVGYVGLFIIIFLETGLFIGFFLPGDSLVFTAGLLAAKGVFNIWILTILLSGTAFLGYSVGYWFGDKLGHWLMRRKESIWFKKRYVEQAHQFYLKHGGKALVLGRLVPIVRTFVPIVAGMGKMKYSTYQFYNFIGALVWGTGVTLAGYYLGTLIPNATHYILPVVMLVIFISILPAIYHYWRSRRSKTDN